MNDHSQEQQSKNEVIRPRYVHLTDEEDIVKETTSGDGLKTIIFPGKKIGDLGLVCVILYRGSRHRDPNAVWLSPKGLREISTKEATLLGLYSIELDLVNRQIDPNTKIQLTVGLSLDDGNELASTELTNLNPSIKDFRGSGEILDDEHAELSSLFTKWMFPPRALSPLNEARDLFVAKDRQFLNKLGWNFRPLHKEHGGDVQK